MPSVTVDRSPIAIDEAAAALQTQLGKDYKVTRREGTEDKIRVETSTLVYANVHLVPADSTTTFHVHGGGLMIGRLLNEMGIARRVAEGIRRSPGLKDGN